MKALKPTMREKKRYMLLKGRVSEAEKAINEGIGVLGMSKVGFSWIKKGTDSGVICVNREAVDPVRASFAIWPKNISVSRVSGTIKGLGLKK